MKIRKTNWVLILILTLVNHCHAETSSLTTVQALYQNAPKSLKASERIDYFSAQLMGIPYKLGPLGEGKSGRFDQSPLYDFTKFDCLTYVETVLALSQSNSTASFKKNLANIRYADGLPNYLTRNHFMSLDWLPNNIKKGWVTDVTCTILDKNKQPICINATAEIDKGAWLLKKSVNDIKLKAPSLKRSRLKELQQQAKRFTPQQAHINYLPLKTLFPNGKADPFLMAQIPNGSIATIVRPNWQLKSLIGTNLNASHVGFIIKKGKKLYFREASMIKKQVADTPLDEYLSKYLSSDCIKGINVLTVNAKAI